MLVSMSFSRKFSKNKPIVKTVGFITLCSGEENSSWVIMGHFSKRVFEGIYGRFGLYLADLGVSLRKVAEGGVIL